MSLTPGNKNPYITAGINKNLLTPCRMPGLSRKRKTPASSAKTPLFNSPVITGTPKLENTHTENGTPLVSARNKANNVKNSISKVKNKISKRLAMDMEKNDDITENIEETVQKPVNNVIEDTKDQESDEDMPLVQPKTPKKEENVKNNLKEPIEVNKTTNKNNIKPLKPKVTNIKQNITEETHKNTVNDDIKQTINSESDYEDKPMVKNKSKKEKATKNKKKLKEVKPKQEKNKITETKIIEKPKNDSDTENTPLKIKIKLDDDVNKTKIIPNQQKLETQNTSDEISMIIKRKIHNDTKKQPIYTTSSDDEQIISVKKQKKNFISSDVSSKTVEKPRQRLISSDSDEDFQINTKNVQKTYTKIKVKAEVHPQKPKVIKKVDSVESDIQKLKELEKTMDCSVKLDFLSGSQIKTLLTDPDKIQNYTKPTKESNKTEKPLIILQKNYEEDDDFTCSPNEEKFSKTDTLKTIKYLELSNKGKKEKIAKLKQAEVYQNLHKVGELGNLTKIWTNGCKLALEDLLKQLQAHGPMDMGMLLKKLNIPEKISNKFKFTNESN